MKHLDPVTEAIFGLGIMAHEKHGGHMSDLEDCPAHWCVQARGAIVEVQRRREKLYEFEQLQAKVRSIRDGVTSHGVRRRIEAEVLDRLESEY